MRDKHGLTLQVTGLIFLAAPLGHCSDSTHSHNQHTREVCTHLTFISQITDIQSFAFTLQSLIKRGVGRTLAMFTSPRHHIVANSDCFSGNYVKSWQYIFRNYYDRLTFRCSLYKVGLPFVEFASSTAGWKAHRGDSLLLHFHDIQSPDILTQLLICSLGVTTGVQTCPDIPELSPDAELPELAEHSVSWWFSVDFETSTAPLEDLPADL